MLDLPNARLRGDTPTGTVVFVYRYLPHVA